MMTCEVSHDTIFNNILSNRHLPIVSVTNRLPIETSSKLSSVAGELWFDDYTVEV